MWCDPRTGLPRTYKIAVLGTRYLARAEAKGMLRIASAVGVTQATKEHKESWLRTTRIQAGED